MEGKSLNSFGIKVAEMVGLPESLLKLALFKS